MIANVRRNLRRLMVICALAAAACGTAPAAMAQDDDIAVELQCLRYIQAYERSMAIPVGLLASISLVESGRPGPDGKLVAWPWTINVNGKGTFFDTKEEAVNAVRKLMDEGQRSIDVGCMQINLRYHPNAFTSIDEAFNPASNVAYGAKFLKSLHDLQGSWPNAVERFHSSDDGRRAEYRDKVLAFWNDQARNMIMDTVMAENTDTPYHKALRAFVAGDYAQAVQQYESIVDGNPKDRIGLLGLAMTYEKMGRAEEAAASYMHYLVVEPTNESVAAHIADGIMHQPPAQARAQLEAYLKAGVRRDDFLSLLSQVCSTLGDDAHAITYAVAAAKAAPNVAIYQLNAGILADRLKRKSEAVAYYSQFLDLFERSPVLVETSVVGIRNRMQFLAAQL
jgi:tetratricopeptide (TPR) repeat protein